jgi:hypothetical protein
LRRRPAQPLVTAKFLGRDAGSTRGMACAATGIP